MIDCVDQTGQLVTIPETPKRIISLVPSQTELLFDLGLDIEVLGITKFCVHPEQWFRHKTRVGGTKQLKMDIIHSLAPDLIIANKEENVKEQVEALQKHYPVWISDINNLEDALEMIKQIGAITAKQDEAKEISAGIKEGFVQLKTKNNKPQTIYLIWKDPYMTVGSDTFIHSMMGAAGFSNVFTHAKRYPEITLEELQSINPELLLLSSEPFPFKEKHVEELRPILPGTKILLVDGEMFSWYGSRLLHAPKYFMTLNEQLF